MSFAVFGVSKELAKTQATKYLKKIEKEGVDSAKEKIAKWKFDRKLSKVDVALKILASIGEIPQKAYQNALSELVTLYLHKLTPKQISPVYGDPRRCSEFIDLARRYGAQRLIAKQCIRAEDPKKKGVFKSKWNEVPASMMR